MCGFIVLIGQFESGVAKAASEKIIHRGPDELGIFEYKNIQFATRRLSILDRQGGQQPFVNREKTKVLAYNGEIFNSTSIRKKLLNQGVRFESTHSDTETLFNLLSNNLYHLIPKLNGMYSFAYLDLSKNELLIARDYAGQKPLYWAISSQGLIISSEITPIKFLIKQLDYNYDAIKSYMEFGYIPFSQTAYKQIYKLKPGDILKFDIESLTMKYTNLSPLNEDNYSPSIDKKPDLHQLNDLVEKSALNWTISDVPFAVSLSDGLDSSLLVSILAEKSHSKFTTYTLNYKTNKNNFITSSPLIKKYKLDHIDVVIDGHDIANDIHEMVRALGEPYSGGLPSWFIYKEISQKYKVAVTGTGADELFGNYDKSKLIKKIEKFKIIGLYSLFQTFVRTFSFNTDITENARSIQESISKKIIKEDGTFINMLSKTDSLNLFLNTKNYSLNNKIIKSKFLTLEDYVFCFDFNTQLSDELLFMADRFSMHFSVESRAPFLDKDLIDYISTLDRKYFIKNGSKYYLRKIGEKWLTEDLLKNQKKGFIVPEYELLKNELSEIYNFYLSDTQVKKVNIFNLQQIKYWRNRFETQPRNKYVTNMIWRLLNLNIWLEMN